MGPQGAGVRARRGGEGEGGVGFSLVIAGLDPAIHEVHPRGQSLEVG